MVRDKFLPTDFESLGYKKKEFGFQLLKLEDIFSLKSSAGINPFKPHCINFFTLLLLTEGEMTYEVDFVEYKLIQGDCLLISKEQIHKFDHSYRHKGYGIIFTEEFMLRHLSLSAFSKLNFSPNLHLSPLLFKDFGDRDIFLNALKKNFHLILGESKVMLSPPC